MSNSTLATWMVLGLVAFCALIFFILSLQKKREDKKLPVKPSSVVPTAEVHKRNMLEVLHSDINIHQSPDYVDCEPMIMMFAEKDFSKEDYSDWEPNEDYERISLSYLYNFCFDQLATGKYYLLAGIPNPVGMQLIEIMKSTLRKAVRLGYVNAEELKICEQNIREQVMPF